MRRTISRAVALASALSVAFATSARAASPAASACPDYFFLSGNLALNPNFETPAPGVPIGSAKCWQNGDPSPVTSAAANWQMHSSNAGAPVCSTLVSGSAPGPGGSTLLAFRAGSNEGGIYQSHALDPKKAYMFSVWVMVRSGQLAIQSRGMTGGPVAWTSKIGEWEQLRVCTDGSFPPGWFFVYNQDPTGGAFYVDKVEIRPIP